MFEIATEFEIGADDFLLAQEFRQRQHHVSRRDARLRLARKLYADDFR